MDRGYLKTITGILVVAVMFFYSNFTFAYPTQGTSDQPIGTSTQMPFSINLDWIGNTWNTVSAGFQGFINGIGSFFNGDTSMNAIGNSVSNIPIGGTNSHFTLGNAYQDFDNWLYGAAGFRISGFFNAILNVIIWLLNLAKEIINWFLSLVH